TAASSRPWTKSHAPANGPAGRMPSRGSARLNADMVNRSLTRSFKSSQPDSGQHNRAMVQSMPWRSGAWRSLPGNDGTHGLGSEQDVAAAHRGLEGLGGGRRPVHAQG